MAGIINWNELWKMMVSGHKRRGDHGEDMGHAWDRRAKKFNESVMQHTERTLRQTLPQILASIFPHLSQ